MDRFTWIEASTWTISTGLLSKSEKRRETRQEIYEAATAGAYRAFRDSSNALPTILPTEGSRTIPRSRASSRLIQAAS